MTVLACGINHKTAPIELREKLAFSTNSLQVPLMDLLKQDPIHEAAILSTCNRTELYCATEDSNVLLDWLAAHHLLDHSALEPHLYFHHDDDALIHMTRVACGLDSMMIGEAQIFGQLKEAYQTAQTAGTIGPKLYHCFRHVFQATKRVRTETEIGFYATSVAAAAVDLLKERFVDLPSQRFLLIGAGDTVELVGRHLKAQECTQFTIANRTTEKAQHLAEALGGTGYDIGRIPDLLPQADVIITATACPLPFLSVGMIEQAMKTREDRELCLIDLAIPRDIEAGCANIENVNLYNIDDLQNIVEKNKEKRSKAAEVAEQLILEEAAQYAETKRSLNSVESIRHYRTYVQSLCQKELERAREELTRGENAVDVLEDFAYRLSNKVMHQPTLRLREAGSRGRTDLLMLAQHLFKKESNSVN